MDKPQDPAAAATDQIKDSPAVDLPRLVRPLWVDEVNYALDELNAAYMELELGAGNIESAKSGIRRAHMRMLHALACAPQSHGTNY